MKTTAKGKQYVADCESTELLIERIERAAKDGGFSNPSAFIRGGHRTGVGGT